MTPGGLPNDAKAVRDVVAAYLEAMQDPAAGEALHALYAAGAPLRWADAIVPRSAIGRGAFAANHREVVLAGAGRLPAFGAPTLVSWSPTGIAWLEVPVDGHEAPLSLGAGLVQEAGGLRVEWLVCTAKAQPWTFAMGRAQTLAEFTYRDPALVARAWVDVAYMRFFALDRPQMLTLPGATFSCQGSGACCTYDMHVSLPPDAQQVLDALPWGEIAPDLVGRTTLTARADGKLLLKDSGERCRFLDDQKRCVVHMALGRAVFQPCHIFPFAFTATPDGVVATMSHVCGSVRHKLGLPLTARHPDLQDKSFMVPSKVPEAFYLYDEVDVPWEVFKAVEGQLLAYLEREDLPLLRRLWLGSRYLENVAEGDLAPDPAWEAEPITPLDDAGSARVHDLLRFATMVPRPLFREVLPLNTEPLPRVSQDQIRGEALLAEIFRNAVFSKAVSFKHDLLTAHNVLCVFYVLALTLQALHTEQGHAGKADGTAEDGIPSRFWREIAAEAHHGSLANYLFREGETGDSLRALLHGFKYGPWVLRHAAGRA